MGHTFDAVRLSHYSRRKEGGIAKRVIDFDTAVNGVSQKRPAKISYLK
jgi:hypothetical protein